MDIKNNHGFTWIELIVVMVILGIISAFVAGSLMSSDTELAARTEVIKTHLRYAQSRSMNSNTIWYIQLSSNSYSLYKKGDAVPKLLPGGDSPTITLPGGMSISSGTVSFDEWGKPFTDIADPPTAQGTDRTLTVSDSSGSRDIIVTKNTGFIQ
jgi:MSHA pilin protein MshC